MIIKHDFVRATNRHAVAKGLPHVTKGARLLVGFDLLTRALYPADLRQGALTFSASKFFAMSDRELRELDAALVMSPLVLGRFDAIDIARRLADVAFKGQYCAVAYRLPAVQMVARELAAACPGLNVRVLELTEAQFGQTVNAG